ncbi:MAG: site-specific integrase [Actinomycetota bacterium]
MLKILNYLARLSVWVASTSEPFPHCNMGTQPSSRSSVLGWFPGQGSPRLYDSLVEIMRARHFSPRTIDAYVGWITRYLKFYEGRHPRVLREDDVNRFVSHLATRGKVAAATQNQALAAILFLHKVVLREPLDRVEGIVRARRPRRLPVVLQRTEVHSIL